MIAPVDAIFEPRSVAVYGASSDERKLGHTLLRNVLTGGFDGRVVPVNPAGGRILGVEAVPALNGPVDLALISVPVASAELAVADAARAGCLAAIVLASGFGETGPAGKAVEARLADIARSAGMRLVGPNCMGVVSRRQSPSPATPPSGGGDSPPPAAAGQSPSPATPPGRWFNGSYFWQTPRLT